MYSASKGSSGPPPDVSKYVKLGIVALVAILTIALVGNQAVLFFMNYEEFSSVSKEKTVSVVLSNCVLNIVLPNEVDINIEIKRLEFEKQELISREDGLSKRLNDNRFLSNAPQDIIDKETERLNSIIERKNRIEDLLSKTINS